MGKRVVLGRLGRSRREGAPREPDDAHSARAVPVIPQIVTASGAVLWQSGMVIDGDGCPTCYAPAGSGLVALDYLANAGKPGDWYGLVCDGNGDPIIQPSGYYLSPTALVDRTKGIADPARYVDSNSVPYVSICPELRSRYFVQLGDLAMVIHFGRTIGAIVADISPHNHYGEASIACARPLGIPPSPKNGGVSSGVTYVLFPHTASSPAWPRDIDDIQQRAAALFAGFGGLGAVPWLGAA